MCYKPLFDPIEPKAERWSITKLHESTNIFLAEVIDRSFVSLCERYPKEADLYRILEQTVERELIRISSVRWACDPEDDQDFWEVMAYAVQHKTNAHELLKQVIKRYAKEMCSQFEVSHYRLIALAVHCTLVGFLKPPCLKLPFKIEKELSYGGSLEKKFHIKGKLDMVRKLAKEGTLVLVPTHVSNCDSVVTGLAMKQLGISPLSWGAGLNLFNNRGFRYIFSKMGVYKVDRRKKNIPYLQTQKYYSCVTLEWGCHTLFYAGGTRSRSGAIESHLKLGLLSTLFEAQYQNFLKKGLNAKKLFIVPIVLNYHCVLEAEELVRESASIQGFKEVGFPLETRCNKLVLSKKMLLYGTEIFISLGSALDVMGNNVDSEGNSYNEYGMEIDLYRQFMGLLKKDGKSMRPDGYLTMLSNKIVATYRSINSVLSSHLVAFVAYELVKVKENFLHLSNIILRYDVFIEALNKVYKALLLLYEQKKIEFTPIVQAGKLEAIIADGVARLGIYHSIVPMIRRNENELLVQDVRTLWYYHNRLSGYELEKLFVN